MYIDREGSVIDYVTGWLPARQIGQQYVFNQYIKHHVRSHDPG